MKKRIGSLLLILALCFTLLPSAAFAEENEQSSKISITTVDELLQFANSLSLRGFPISTISLILCWDKHKFTSKKLSRLMKGETVKIEHNFDRANAFLNAMSNFTDKFIAKNYAINVVIDLSSEMGYKPVCEALSKISKATIQRIDGITGEENVKSFLKDAINKELGK